MKPTPIRLDFEQRAKAKYRATLLGLSIAGYIRHLIDNDK